MWKNIQDKIPMHQRGLLKGKPWLSRPMIPNFTISMRPPRSFGSVQTTRSLEEIFSEMLETYEVESELRADILDFIQESQSKGMLDLLESAKPL